MLGVCTMFFQVLPASSIHCCHMACARQDRNGNGVLGVCTLCSLFSQRCVPVAVTTGWAEPHVAEVSTHLLHPLEACPLEAHPATAHTCGHKKTRRPQKKPAYAHTHATVSDTVRGELHICMNHRPQPQLWPSTTRQYSTSLDSPVTTRQEALSCRTASCDCCRLAAAHWDTHTAVQPAAQHLSSRHSDIEHWLKCQGPSRILV